jgi:acyl-[acyl-carrier-protein]-phospholipid O-acyltransferase/long-chain-fatty-acid--[acyl-carrier-protein] ligase
MFLILNVFEGDSENSRILVATTGAIFILPFFLFSSLAGEVADKYEKSKLIKHIKSMEILIVAIACLGFLIANYYLLLFSLFLMGTQSTFFGPLKYALLPQLLEKKELTTANAMLQAGTYFAIMTGTILGGILAGLIGSASKIIIIHILCLAIAGRICAHFIPIAVASDNTIKIRQNLPKATISIVKEAISDRLNLILIFLISGFWFTSSAFVAAVPTYAKLLLGADANVITILNLAFVIGIGLGAFLCTLLTRGQIRPYLVCLGAVGVGLTSLTVLAQGTPPISSNLLQLDNFLSSRFTIIFFTQLVLVGTFGALYVIPLYACLQINLRATHRARTIAALNVCNAFFMVLSALFTVVIYRQGANEPQLFGVIGLLNLAVIGTVYPIFNKNWSNLQKT